MTTTIIQADYERLGNIATRFGKHSEATSQTMQQLCKGMERLHGSWQGEGSTAFLSEMQSAVLPATQRLIAALGEAQSVTTRISETLRQAEEEAAALFKQEPLNRVPGNARSFAGSEIPAEQGSEEKLRNEIVKLLDDRFQVKNDSWQDIFDRDNAYRYTIQELHLEQLSLQELQALKGYLESGQLSLTDTLDQVGILQEYWGYDNARMISALREIYYPDALDPFIADSNSVTSAIYDVQGARGTISESQAALARALLMLSTQGPGYRDPILRTEFPAGYGNPLDDQGRVSEFGFDHVIAGLDGHAHPLVNGLPLFSPEGAALRARGTDIGKINSLDAVTWQGDLGGTVNIGLHNSHSDWPISLIPQSSLSPDYATNPAAQAGYAKEMPLQDFNGDMFASAIVQAGVVKGSDQNLAQVLTSAFDPGGPVAQQRYQLFAQQLRVTYDPATGAIDPVSRTNFLNQNLQPVSDFGWGLHFKGDTYVFSAPVEEAIATANMNYFLDQIQAGLQQEISSP